jgi:hypothetical protein
MRIWQWLHRARGINSNTRLAQTGCCIRRIAFRRRPALANLVVREIDVSPLDIGTNPARQKTSSVATNVKGLLLRSAEPLAARRDGKHQRLLAPVFSCENRHLWLYASRTGQSHATLKSASKKTLGYETRALRLRASVALPH